MGDYRWRRVQRAASCKLQVASRKSQVEVERIGPERCESESRIWKLLLVWRFHSRSHSARPRARSGRCRKHTFTSGGVHLACLYARARAHTHETSAGCRCTCSARSQVQVQVRRRRRRRRRWQLETVALASRQAHAGDWGHTRSIYGFGLESLGWRASARRPANTQNISHYVGPPISLGQPARPCSLFAWASRKNSARPNTLASGRWEAKQILGTARKRRLQRSAQANVWARAQDSPRPLYSVQAAKDDGTFASSGNLVDATGWPVS